MAFSKEIPICKDKILNTILNDYELVRLIDETYVDPTTETVKSSDALVYNKVFPYYFNPDGITDAISFVIMKVDTPTVQDRLIKNMSITITVASNQSLMKVPFGIGTRIDQMGACIDRLLNGREDLGFGKLMLKSVFETSINAVYRCREITFIVDEFNDTRGSL